MLLTDELIDELHAFRVGMMAQSAAVLKTKFDFTEGQPIGSGFANFTGDGSPTTQVYESVTESPKQICVKLMSSMQAEPSTGS